MLVWPLKVKAGDVVQFVAVGSKQACIAFVLGITVMQH